MSRSALKTLARGVAASTVATFAFAALPAQAANVFRFAFQGDLKSLDPYSLKESFTEGMQQAAYESLVTLDKNLKFAPGLAESWETPEPTRWRFHLRKNVTDRAESPELWAGVAEAQGQAGSTGMLDRKKARRPS